MTEAIHQAVKQGNVDKLKEVLANEEHNVNSYSSSGLTALHLLAQTGNLALLPVLLENKALVNQRAEKKSVYDGYNCLHFAAEHPNSTDLLSALVEKGADCKAEDVLKRIPLHVAALKGNVPASKALTALHPDGVNAKDQYGRTPLMLACSQGHYHVVQHLLSLPHCNIDAQDNDGNTALHHCFQIQSQHLFNYNYPLGDGHYQSSFELVKAGASLTILNKENDAAIDVINVSLADLLEVISKERSKLGQISSIEELISLDTKELQEIQLDVAVQPKFFEAIEAFTKIMERELELKKTRGSCPFIDNSVVPEIRKFKKNPPPKTAMPFATSGPSSSTGEAKCPMGFTGEKPTFHSEVSTMITPDQLDSILAARQFNEDDSLLWPMLAASAVGAALGLSAAFLYARFAK